MNQEDIFKKIGHILSELNDQYQYLAQNPQELNELELELFLANVSFLTDHVQIIRKLNIAPVQKALPEHTESLEPVQETITLAELQEEIPAPEAVIIESPAVEMPVADLIPEKPILEQEIFKLDNDASTFEFILNEKLSSDRFDFKEKSIDEIFDRPLSKEEEEIIAQKQKLRESDSLESDLPEEDEIGPEPFLVEHDPEPEPSAIADEPEEFTEDKHVIDEVPVTATKAQEELFSLSSAPVPANEPIVEPIVQPVFTEPVKLTEEVVTEPAAETTTATPVKLTLNDILSGNTQGGTHKPEVSRTITDLKQAISLNDKLRYIRDLFNGYNLAYAEAIDLLNKMPDFKTADNFLQNNYAVKNNWSAKQDTADQFYELLNQRFPAR